MSEPTKRDPSDSSQPTTLSKDLSQALRFEALSQNILSIPDNPDEILKKTLSIHSVVSTSSSFAERMNRNKSKGEDKLDLRTIGLGSCGTVFEIGGTELAYKKGSKINEIRQDFDLTNRVHDAITATRLMLQKTFGTYTVPQIPRCHGFVNPDDEDWWAENLQRFPQTHRTKGALFTVDRILPLPQKTREALIKKYFDDDEKIQNEAMNDEENQHCLVRVYLGQNENPTQQSSAYESLRNFPMRLNMFEDLDLETSELTIRMAIGLAIVHWQAQVDGMDIEFVLGSAATIKSELGKAYEGDTLPHSVKFLNFEKRSIHLWILDFDKASRIEININDVDKKLVPAFLGNDPYYPRPDVDEDLWNEFCSAYLKASKLILKSKKAGKADLKLPRRFLDKVMEKINEHEGWDPEKNIVFEN